MATNLIIICFICLSVGFGTCKNIFVINSYDEIESNEDDLVSVVVLYRHGDRSPTGSFPTDPYFNSSYWPEGYGQLLPKGMLRQYHLGQWLRNRYNTFLPTEYSYKDIVVYSTDVDRTLMSAEANLAGLYPPPASQIWEEDLLWEPIPVHQLATDDPILAMNSPCTKFDKLLMELETSEFFLNISKEYSDLFNKLSNYTGMTVSSVGDVAGVYDVIYVYSNHNESYVPSWVDDIDLEQVKYLAGLEFARLTFTQELKRLRAGPFINYVIDHFDDIVNNVADTEKLLMLSAHDSTVSSVLGGMSLFDNHPPEFTSTVMFELRKNKKDEHYVNVLYKRNSTDAYEELTVGSCDFDCVFNDFKTNLASVNVDIATWHGECQITSSSIQVVLSWGFMFLLLILQKFI